MDFTTKAFQIWYDHYEHGQADEKVRPFLNDEIKPYRPSQVGCLKRTRKALLLSTGKVAGTLGISRGAYTRLEKNEECGSITLQSLNRAAEAMDCEVILALRPKKKILFSEMIWKQLLLASLKHTWVQSRSEIKKSLALAAIAKSKMEDSNFRKKQQWSEKKEETSMNRLKLFSIFIFGSIFSLPAFGQTGGNIGQDLILDTPILLACPRR